MVEDKFIDINGVTTRYKDVGSGKPIVMIHGGEFAMGAGSDAWPDELYEGFAAAGYRAIGIDRLGQAKTHDPLRPEDYRISAVLEHAKALLREIGALGAAVIGQSRGGYIVSRLALEAPDIVDRLIIVNSGTITPNLSVQPVPGTPAYHVYKEVMGDDAHTNAAAVSYTTEHITDEWVAKLEAMYKSPVRANTAAAYEEQKEAFFEEFEVKKAETVEWLGSGKFTKPSLIIWGIGDPTTDPTDALSIFTTLRNGGVEHLRLYYINRSGHWPFREYPDEFKAIVLDFLSRSY